MTDDLSTRLYWQKLRLFVFVSSITFATVLGTFLPPVIICTDQTGSLRAYCMSMQIIMYVFFGLCAAQFLVLMTCSFYHRYVRDRLPKELPDPKHRTVFVVPCYGESQEELQNTVDSISEVKGDSLAVFVVDGLLSTAETLLEKVLALPWTADAMSTREKYTYRCALNNRDLETNEVVVFEGTYKSMPCVVLVKVSNSGKKDSITLVLQLLKGLLPSMADACGLHGHAYDNLMLLDADTTIDPACLSVFEHHLEQHPDTIGICGETRVRSSWNPLVMAQKYEYWYSHIVLKTFEDVVYTVLVLSGCFAMYRLEYLLDETVLEAYMTRDPNSERTLRTENIVQLGEDRYLTSLLLQRFPESRLMYTSRTYCHTSPPENVKTLLCQRRRWTNSLIHCHHALLATPPGVTLWKRIRLFYILIVELWTVYALPSIMTIGLTLFFLGFIGFKPFPWFVAFLITCMCQSLLFAIFALRVDMMILWPAYFLFTPFFSIVIPLYSLWCSDHLQWGLTRKVHDEAV